MLKNYYVRLSLLSVFGIVLSASLYHWLPGLFNAPTWWIAPLFFVVTTLASHFILTRGDKASKEFVQKVMASSVGRLLLSMIIVLIYSKLDKPHGMAFAFHFMLQYVLFTIFEIAYLLRYLKQ